MKKGLAMLLIGCLYAVSAYGQLKVISVEKVPVLATQEWNCPRFSPDGKSIFTTNATFTGIWKFNLSTSLLQEISHDRSSGLNFVISADGNQVSYRRSRGTAIRGERIREIVIRDIAAKSSRIISSGKDISAPVLVNAKVVYAKGSALQNLSKTSAVGSIALLGIENEKIILIKNGRRAVLDPLKNGHYIWPSLSPDKKRLVAYDVDRGTFICDVDGKNIVKLGRLDSPSWTRDGKWIVYMDDKDDGQTIYASDIFAVSIEGKNKVQLTTTPDIIEMNPSCSMTEDKIVVNSISGDVYVITYEVMQ